MFKHHIIFQNFVDRLRNMRQDLIKNIQHTHTPWLTNSNPLHSNELYVFL